MADASYILEEKLIDVFTLCSRGSRTVETATSAAPSGVQSLGTSNKARRFRRGLRVIWHFRVTLSACARTWPGRMIRATTTPRIARLTDPPTLAGYRALV